MSTVQWTMLHVPTHFCGRTRLLFPGLIPTYICRHVYVEIVLQEFGFYDYIRIFALYKLFNATVLWL